MKEEYEKYFITKYPWLRHNIYNNEPGITMPMAGIDNGWFKILDTLCAKIDIELKKNPELEKHFVVTCIKQKWGGLCFYVMTATDAIFNAIDQAETQSLITCEICGKKAGPKKIRGWISTLCWFHTLLHKWGLLK